jgi:hypothetical protein
MALEKAKEVLALAAAFAEDAAVEITGTREDGAVEIVGLVVGDEV